MKSAELEKCRRAIRGIWDHPVYSKEDANEGELQGFMAYLEEKSAELDAVRGSVMGVCTPLVDSIPDEDTTGSLSTDEIYILENARGEFGRTTRKSFANRIKHFGYQIGTLQRQIGTVLGAYKTGDYSEWARFFGSPEQAREHKARILTSLDFMHWNDEVRTAIDSLEDSLKKVPGKNSISNQLEELFEGKLDEQTLRNLTRNVDSGLEKVTLQTGSTGIIRFYSEGNRGYGKVSTNKPALKNEYKAIETVRADGLARVLAPIPIGLVETDDAGALFTWGTENKGMYSEEDVKDYFSIFNTLLFTYAQSRGLNLTKLAKDRNMQDVFNRALIHSSGIKFDAVYERPVIVPLEELERRAGQNIKELGKLREFNQVYNEASKRAGDLNPGVAVFLHGDARPENIGKDPYGVRPLVDWANAHMGSAATELSSLETQNTGDYVGWYNYIMDFRGGQSLGKDAQDLIVCHDVMQPYRTASFKFGKDRIKEAQRDIKRLGINVSRYKAAFN